MQNNPKKYKINPKLYPEAHVMSVYKSTIYNGKHALFFIRCCFTCELRVTANIHLSDAKFNGVKYEEEIIARIQNTRTQLRPGCNETHTHIHKLAWE